jgi:hypothetical protein
MKLRFKMALLSLSAGMITLAWGGWGWEGCGRFWGDVVGDSIWLSIVD